MIVVGLTVAIGACALGASTGESESCADPDQKLFDAVTKFGDKDFSGSIAILDEAEGCATEPRYKARVQRQKGLAFDALNRRLEGMISFGRALELDPSIALIQGEHSPSAIRLFDCAKALGPQKLDDIEFRLKLEEALKKDDWTCPLDQSSARFPITVVKEREGPSRWPMWTALGVGAAGAAVGTIFAIQAKSKDSDSRQPGRCDPNDPALCTSEGAALRSDARSAGNIATVGTIIAVLGFGAGAAFWLWSPSDEDSGAQGGAAPAPKSASLLMGPGGFGVRGTW